MPHPLVLHAALTVQPCLHLLSTLSFLTPCFGVPLQVDIIDLVTQNTTLLIHLSILSSGADIYSPTYHLAR